MFDWLSKPKMEWSASDDFCSTVCWMLLIFILLALVKVVSYIRAKRHERWVEKNNKYWERKDKE